MRAILKRTDWCRNMELSVFVSISNQQNIDVELRIDKLCNDVLSIVFSMNFCNAQRHLRRGRWFRSIDPTFQTQLGSEGCAANIIWRHINARNHQSLNGQIEGNVANASYSLYQKCTSVPVYNLYDDLKKLFIRLQCVSCWVGITQRKRCLFALLNQLVIESEEGDAGGRRCSPAAERAHPFADAVLFTSDAPRVFPQHGSRHPIGGEPTKQWANDNAEPENELVLPHERMRSTSSVSFARAA